MPESPSSVSPVAPVLERPAPGTQPLPAPGTQPINPATGTSGGGLVPATPLTPWQMAKRWMVYLGLHAALLLAALVCLGAALFGYRTITRAHDGQSVVGMLLLLLGLVGLACLLGAMGNLLARFKGRYHPRRKQSRRPR